jgi:threonine dehydrogenase-like Zn-dependent dehydrogenase
VIEAVGHGEQALNLCIALCRHGGRILYFGVPPETIDGVRWRDLLQKNLTVHTSINPSFERDFPLAMRWITESRIDLMDLITHRFPLSEIQTAFETFKYRKDGALKVAVEFPAYTQNALVCDA